MQHPVNWRERFNIPEQADGHAPDSAGEAQGSPEDRSLRQALISGTIPEHDYIDWAMSTFELPSVTGDFFTAPPDLEFWKSVRDLHDWHPGFFPLSVWEGVLTVGCLRPPHNLNSFQMDHDAQGRFENVQFVLASARHLLLLWNQYNAPTAKPAAPVSEAAPAKPQRVIEAADGLLEQLVVPVGDPDLPEGFLMGGPKADPNTPKFNERITFEMPDGVNEDQAAVMADKPDVDAPEGTLVGYAADLSNATGSAIQEIPRDDAEPMEDSRIMDVSELGNGSGVIAIPKIETDEPNASDEKSSFTLSGLDVRPVDTAKSMEDLSTVVLVHLLEKFDGAMFLLYEGGALKPWKWSSVMTSEKNGALKQIDIATPSMFRIAANTQLPYHGYVSPSPVNNAFFEAYHEGKTPKHVTLVPFFVNKHLAGMLMGISRQPVHYRGALLEVQKLAERTGEQAFRLRVSQAA